MSLNLFEILLPFPKGTKKDLHLSCSSLMSLSCLSFENFVGHMSIVEKDGSLHGMILTLDEVKPAFICSMRFKQKPNKTKKPHTIPPNPPKSASLI